MCLGNLRRSIYDNKNKKPVNFHFITPQIPQALNTFQESYNIEYFKVVKRLKSLQKAERYLEPKRASMIELFCEYT